MRERLGPIAEHDLTDAQRAAAREIVEGPRGAVYAARVGIPASTIQAIAARQRPRDMLVDEAVVHDFCRELHETKAVSDRVYADALALFGEQGVIDLVGINGYYTLLAMVMNTACTGVPA